MLAVAVVVLDVNVATSSVNDCPAIRKLPSPSGCANTSRTCGAAGVEAGFATVIASVFVVVLPSTSVIVTVT